MQEITQNELINTMQNAELITFHGMAFGYTSNDDVKSIIDDIEHIRHGINELQTFINYDNDIITLKDKATQNARILELSERHYFQYKNVLTIVNNKNSSVLFYTINAHKQN